MDDFPEQGIGRPDREGSDRASHRGRLDPQAVEDAFGELSEMPEPERAAALGRLRTIDPPLADEVASLLRHHDDASPDDAHDRERRLSVLSGESVGGCRIGRLIGAGGMGAVYEAVQDFPRRRVAVKVVRGERMSDASALRLRIEAEALARLAHPNIARVYSAGSCALPGVDDGGAGDRDTPYIVLELVEGAVNLTRWADERGLPPTERIELVAKVAEALAHAHRAGVIHRDLKPGNVIVGLDGVPKVIDFGIAAIVDAQQTGGTLGPMGTLLYMSPEQAGGGVVDTRSDVWGLGALLYDLLAGAPPFSLAGDSLAKHVARLLREPPEPVTIAAGGRRDARFVRAIPAATDAVLAKALATDAERRYRSATELADELRRLVRGEPLIARPDSTLDAAVRIFRRNRAPILAACGVAAAIVAALVWTVFLLGREREALARAEWHSYRAAIAAAGGMIDRGDASAAKDVLQAAPERLRDWEWLHLAGRADQSLWGVSFGRGQQVYGLDFSPDGTRLLAAVSSLSVAIDVPSRTVLWAVQGHSEGACWRVRILPDGGGIFVRLDRQLERLDATGAVVAIATEPGIDGIALDRAGSRLFNDTADGFNVRDPRTLELRRTVEADPPLAGVPSSIVLTPDDDRVILGDTAGNITALDVESGATAWTARIPGSTAEIRGLAISPVDGSVAAVALNHIVMIDSRDGTITWHRTMGGRSFFSPSFTPDGRELLVATWQETIDRFETREGRRLGSASGIFSQVWATAASPDGRTFAAGGLSSRIALFPLDASIEPASLEFDGSAVQSVALGHGATAGLAFATTESGSLWRFEVANDVVERVDTGLEANWVAGGPAGDCAVGHAGGVAWISPDGRVVEDLRLPTPVKQVSILDDRHAFAVCETSELEGSAFIVRRTGDGAGPATWALPPRGFDCGAASPTASKGEFFIPSGHRGGVSMTVRLTDEEGRPLDPPLMTSLNEQPEYPLTAALSPDGSTLAIGCVLSDGEVTLSDPRTFTQQVNMPNHRGKVRSLAWSPDGARLASAGTDDTVRIWHMARGEEILVAWRGAANDLAWGEDGTLWIACGDGKIRLLRSSAAPGSPGPTGSSVR